MEKRQYEAPEATRLGTCAELTANAGLPNSDVPSGPANTAHCSIVDCPPPS